MAAYNATSNPINNSPGLCSRSKPMFPWLLHNMLDDAEIKGFEDIVSWNPSGDSFKVHDRPRFIDNILPQYISASKYKSYVRQLNMWGFSCIHGGRKCELRGSYQHDKFIRGKPHLCHDMKRIKIKGNAKKRIQESQVIETDSCSSNAATTTPPTAHAEIHASSATAPAVQVSAHSQYGYTAPVRSIQPPPQTYWKHATAPSPLPSQPRTMYHHNVPIGQPMPRSFESDLDDDFSQPFSQPNTRIFDDVNLDFCAQTSEVDTLLLNYGNLEGFDMISQPIYSQSAIYPSAPPSSMNLPARSGRMAYGSPHPLQQPPPHPQHTMSHHYRAIPPPQRLPCSISDNLDDTLRHTYRQSNGYDVSARVQH